jgi:hypothetical protein
MIFIKFPKVLFLSFCFSFCLNAQNPNWSVNSANYSLDASIIAELQIDETKSTDINDIVAVFDEDNELRGVGNVLFIPPLNKYLLFLTINGNKGGDELTFKVYNSIDDTVLDVPDLSLEFIPNKIIGSLDTPFLITAIKTFLPSVKTYAANNITPNAVSLKGEVLSVGKSNEIIETGFLFSTEDTYPKINEPNISKIPLGNSVGELNYLATNLNTNSNVYYYRAYATNSFGTSYGSVKRFSLNNSLNFDKVDDLVSINDNPIIDFSNGFSIDAMVYPTSFIGKSTIISQFENNQKAFSIEIGTSGNIITTFSTDGSTETYRSSNLKLSLNKWQHIAVCYSNTGEIKIYINANEDTNSVQHNKSIGVIYNSTASIIIGAKENMNFYKGNIDELRIWNKTLNSNIINAIKSKVIPKNIDGLLAYYNFNQGISKGSNETVSILVDKSSNNLNGLLSNFSKSGAISNFVDGVSGDFNNNEVAQNTFTTTGNWSNPSNWSFGQVPLKLNRVIINENKQITIDDKNIEIDDLVLNNNATIKIPKGNAIIINNQFTSNGILDIDSDINDSGVLLVNGKTSGLITYKRGGLKANKWSIVTPPVSGQKVKDFAENSANDIRVNTTPNPNRYAIAYYDDSKPSGSKWVYYTENIDDTEEFTAGQSYSMSRATDGGVTFIGTLSTSNVKKKLIAGKWNAIGNPFTTYYPANKNSDSSFLKDNFSVLDDLYKSLYIWDNSQGKYVAVTEISEVAKSLPPGQGFFIKMKSSENEVHFQKDKRSTKPTSGNTTFDKSNSNLNITLNATLNNTTVSTEIKFFENATIDFDAGYDIGNFNSSNLDIYSRLLEDSNKTNFTIQSLAVNTIDKAKIPLGIKGKKGDVITISAKNVNLPSEIMLYLEDTETHSFINLSDENAFYQFTLKDDYNDVGRFYIHTSTKVLNTNENSFSNINVFTSNKTLIIKGIDLQGVSVKVFSVVGKEVFSRERNSKKDSKISLSNYKRGVYLVKIKSDKVHFTKKIIIK